MSALLLIECMLHVHNFLLFKIFVSFYHFNSISDRSSIVCASQWPTYISEVNKCWSSYSFNAFFSSFSFFLEHSVARLSTFKPNILLILLLAQAHGQHKIRNRHILTTDTKKTVFPPSNTHAKSIDESIRYLYGRKLETNFSQL